ncbi:MAG: AAA family ATPase [Candidatus Lokiarchaeota archaeon]|nr:AAA family ATPase [Candidatus Lokiarchaeota archaeon]
MYKLLITEKKNFDLDKFFDDYLESPNIFKDRNALDSSHIPENLPHRYEQIKAIAEITVVTLRNGIPSNLFIYGKTGTGKTAVIKHISKKLTNKCKRINNMACPNWIYINSNRVKSGYRVLATICNRLNPDDPVPPTGLPRDVLLDKLVNRLDENYGNSICFVVLDEIDCLRSKKSKDSILYLLSRINEILKKSKVILVGISNTLNFKDDLDPRVKSSLCEEELVFPAYKADEIYDILKERTKIALHEDIVTEGALRLISAFAARENGDARRALALLRKSAEFVERRNLKKLDVNLIYEAQDQLDSDKIVHFIRDLPIQQKMILIAVYLNQKFDPENSTNTGEIYNTYKELVKQSYNLNCLTRRRMTDLIKELDLAGIFESKVVSFGRKGGRTRVVDLIIEDAQIIKSFEDDSYWSELLQYIPSSVRRTDLNVYDGNLYRRLFE